MCNWGSSLLAVVAGTDLTLGYQAQYLDFAEWDIKFKRAHATLNSTWIGGKDENIITNNLVVEGPGKSIRSDPAYPVWTLPAED